MFGESVLRSLQSVLLQDACEVVFEPLAGSAIRSGLEEV